MATALRRSLGWNVLLLGALGALVGLYFMLEEEPEDPQEWGLLGIETEAAVQELVLKRRKEIIHLVRTDSGPNWHQSRWRMDSPVQTDANDAAVRELVGALTHLRPLRSLTGEADEGFGLSSPRVEVEVLDTLGRTQTLRIGDVSKFSGAVYAQSSNRPGTHLLHRDTSYLLTQGWIHLRRRQLLTTAKEEITSLEIERPNGSFTLRRTENGEFSLAMGDVSFMADPDRGERSIELLLGLRAQEFLEESPSPDSMKEHALKAPDVIVRATGPEGQERVEFWHRESETEGTSILLARANFPHPALVRLPANQAWPALQADPKDLRDARLQPFQPESVRVMHLEPRQDVPVTLRRKRDQWYLNDAQTAARSEVLVSLHRLATLEARDFAPQTNAPMPTAPAIRLDVDDTQLHWRFGRVEGDDQIVWTRRGDAPWKVASVRANFEKAFEWRQVGYSKPR